MNVGRRIIIIYELDRITSYTRDRSLFIIIIRSYQYCALDRVYDPMGSHMGSYSHFDMTDLVLIDRV